jgi:protocatechuate 3,4-dioxygenase beta subunit
LILALLAASLIKVQAMAGLLDACASREAMMYDTKWKRRGVIAGLAAATVGSLMPDEWQQAFAQEDMAPTPSCDDGDEPTPAQTEGPYFTPNSPERSQLQEEGMTGTPIVLTGLVLTRSCAPVEGALIELWHANDAGQYDNDGFRLRGHQFTKRNGIYRFATIVPGLYPGRTRHFHVKIQASGKSVLTTQFYFPNEPGNEGDGIFNPALLLNITNGSDLTARFDVILA